MSNNIENNIQEWLKLSSQGLFVEAKNFYFNNLFDDIIERFVDKMSDDNRCEVLFSILGFTPEPIILTQRAMTPYVHVIFTTSKNSEYDSEIVSYLEKYLTSDYKIVNLDDDSFGTIYENLRAQMNIYPSSKYVIDITGGKKSMVASAAIFARNYNCDVVYVDYDEYIPTLRRPMPGTERLKVVYSANSDMINAIDFSSLGSINQDVDDNLLSHSSNESTIHGLTVKQTHTNAFSEPKVKSNNDTFKESFNKTFLFFVDERMGNSGAWLPKGIILSMKTERSFMLKHSRTGETLTIQRAQLFGFYRRCKQGIADIQCFIEESSLKVKLFNLAIYRLLNVINYELFKEWV